MQLLNDFQILAQAEQSGGGIIALFMLLVYFALCFVVIAGMWKTFAKAGKPGWAAIIPIYNLVVLVEISGKPLWWIILFFIPLVNVIAAFVICIEVAKRFGQGVGFGIGLALLGVIFFPILGFGAATYRAA